MPDRMERRHHKNGTCAYHCPSARRNSSPPEAGPFALRLQTNAIRSNGSYRYQMRRQGRHGIKERLCHFRTDIGAYVFINSYHDIPLLDGATLGTEEAQILYNQQVILLAEYYSQVCLLVISTRTACGCFTGTWCDRTSIPHGNSLSKRCRCRHSIIITSICPYRNCYRPTLRAADVVSYLPQAQLSLPSSAINIIHTLQDISRCEERQRVLTTLPQGQRVNLRERSLLILALDLNGVGGRNSQPKSYS
mmetsp:Transcript_24065/g.49672  ORF Transcript_24065/g.49672 Transcript_24065/m.49672 type:complete len:249 (-) Transcript_24065:488-1234(-)